MQWPANIVLLGAGKVASAMGRHLHRTGQHVFTIWSRTIRSAELLADQIQASATNKWEAIPQNADLYIILVPDHAITEVAKTLSQHISAGSLVVHTSGATPSDVLLPFFSRYGVFYPLQSFSPGREIDFSEVPLCLHAAVESDYELLSAAAQRLSDKVYQVSDVQRLQLHLAAVFVNNFTNYIQHIGQQLVEEHDLPGVLLTPLLKETIEKLENLNPAQAQTGPALRNDQATIDRHLELLQAHPHWQKIYRLLSEGIQQDLS